MLVGLNLRNANGTPFNPTSYDQLRNWLLSANSVNMAYMLSVQLAVMKLNVEAGYVSGTALVYAPALLDPAFPVTPGLTPEGLISITALMAAANSQLGTNGLTLSAHPFRAYQEALKNALDAANNNTNFVQAVPCGFEFPVVIATPP